MKRAFYQALHPSIRLGLEYSDERSTFFILELGSSLASLPSPELPLPGENRKESGVANGQLLSQP